MEKTASKNPAASGVPVVEKRKPVFIKVDQLKPGTQNHNMTVKVVSSNTVLHKPRSAAALNSRPTRIAECLIGDDTGTIVFTARNEQNFPQIKYGYSPKESSGSTWSWQDVPSPAFRCSTKDGNSLPAGPVVISPDGLFPSLIREVIRRAPHEFKIACLQEIRALFLLTTIHSMLGSGTNMR